MSQQPNEVDSPQPFVMEFDPATFKGRERYAVDNAIRGRGGPGVIAGLRDAFRHAEGKVVLTITTE